MPARASGTERFGSSADAVRCLGGIFALLGLLPSLAWAQPNEPSGRRYDRREAPTVHREGTLAEGVSSREARSAAVRAIPFDQLTGEAIQRLRVVVEDASYFRRLPTQTVACDPEMYTFLVRHPEVVVSLWDVMGITKVTLERTGEYHLCGDDGAGTKCKMDLIFGSDTLHIYQSQGAYEGNLWARELRGRCVVVIHNRPTQLTDGQPGMIAWMDAFMKLENVGADLVVKTLGPLVAKTADHNFIECAGFFSQISQTAKNNPEGLNQVANRLPRVAPKVREEFIQTSLLVARRNATPNGVVGRATRGTPASTRRLLDPTGDYVQVGTEDEGELEILTLPESHPSK